MKNIDIIKGLRNQIQELIRQKAKLTKEREATERALKEIQASNSAVVITIALSYGRVNEDGSYTLKIPRVDVNKNLEEYAISAYADGDERVITVSPRKGERIEKLN